MNIADAKQRIEALKADCQESLDALTFAANALEENMVLEFPQLDTVVAEKETAVATLATERSVFETTLAEKDALIAQLQKQLEAPEEPVAEETPA